VTICAGFGTFAIGDVAALAAIMQALIDQTLPMPDSGDIKKIGAKFSAEAMAASFRSALVEMQNRRAAMD
jgi:hypothetical protein